jgi:hypothetical protein
MRIAREKENHGGAFHKFIEARYDAENMMFSKIMIDLGSADP